MMNERISRQETEQYSFDVELWSTDSDWGEAGWVAQELWSTVVQISQQHCTYDRDGCTKNGCPACKARRTIKRIWEKAKC